MVPHVKTVVEWWGFGCLAWVKKMKIQICFWDWVLGSPPIMITQLSLVWHLATNFSIIPTLTKGKDKTFHHFEFLLSFFVFFLPTSNFITIVFSSTETRNLVEFSKFENSTLSFIFFFLFVNYKNCIPKAKNSSSPLHLVHAHSTNCSTILLPRWWPQIAKWHLLNLLF